MGNPFKPRGGLILSPPVPARRGSEPMESAAPARKCARFAIWPGLVVVGVAVVVEIILTVGGHSLPKRIWRAPLSGLVALAVSLLIAEVRRNRQQRPSGDTIFPPESARRSFESVEFAAPLGGRVRFSTWLSFAIVGAAAVVDIALAIGLRLPSELAWKMALAPVAGLAVVAATFLFSRVRGYRLAGHELQVVRCGRMHRFPLDGLRSVEVDPEAMKFSLKILGNGGLGAITGRYRNLRLGGYRALVTDRGRAVVLRWSDRCLVVSPDHPAEFAAAVRARTGLQS